MTPQISLVIPTYNESKIIIRNLNRIANYLARHYRKFEILVIDDDSPDHTADLIKTTFSKNNQIKTFIRAQNNGLGGAYKYGLLKAKADKCIFIDADLSQPLSAIPVIDQQLDQYGMVIGSRNIPRGRRINTHKFKKIGSDSINLIAKLLLFHNINDSTHSFRGMRTKLAKKIANTTQSSSHPSFFIEFTYRFNLHSLVSETPITFKEDPNRIGHFPLCRAIKSGLIAIFIICKLALYG